MGDKKDVSTHFDNLDVCRWKKKTNLQVCYLPSKVSFNWISGDSSDRPYSSHYNIKFLFRRKTLASTSINIIWLKIGIFVYHKKYCSANRIYLYNTNKNIFWLVCIHVAWGLINVLGKLVWRIKPREDADDDDEAEQGLINSGSSKHIVL